MTRYRKLQRRNATSSTGSGDMFADMPREELERLARLQAETLYRLKTNGQVNIYHDTALHAGQLAVPLQAAKKAELDAYNAGYIVGHRDGDAAGFAIGFDMHRYLANALTPLWCALFTVPYVVASNAGQQTNIALSSLAHDLQTNMRRYQQKLDDLKQQNVDIEYQRTDQLENLFNHTERLIDAIGAYLETPTAARYDDLRALCAAEYPGYTELINTIRTVRKPGRPADEVQIFVGMLAAEIYDQHAATVSPKGETRRTRRRSSGISYGKVGQTIIAELNAKPEHERDELEQLALDQLMPYANYQDAMTQDALRKYIERAVKLYRQRMKEFQQIVNSSTGNKDAIP